MQPLPLLTSLPFSPKFFRKITYVTTLTELAYQVPITQIDIPPAVYQYAATYPASLTQLNHSQREPQV